MGVNVGYFDGHVKWDLSPRLYRTENGYMNTHLPWANAMVY
jgi:prepilin-type processing-associated H-X9-DG protein